MGIPFSSHVLLIGLGEGEVLRFQDVGENHLVLGSLTSRLIQLALIMGDRPFSSYEKFVLSYRLLTILHLTAEKVGHSALRLFIHYNLLDEDLDILSPRRRRLLNEGILRHPPELRGTINPPFWDRRNLGALISLIRGETESSKLGEFSGFSPRGRQ